MHAIEQKILQFFADKNELEKSTSDIVKTVLEKDYSEILELINNPQKDPELVKLGRRKKARLHRKLLYHLNKLEEEKCLVVTKVLGKGEKYFKLNGVDKTNTKADYKKVLESFTSIKDTNFSISGLEDYEQEGIIKKFDNANWISKVNSLLVEVKHFNDSKKLYSLIEDLYVLYNDVVGLYNFQEVVENMNFEDINAFIKKINADTKNYNKYVNIIIDLTKVKNSLKLSDFIRAFADINPDKIFLIFMAKSKALTNQNRMLAQLVKSFSENKIRINIQNTEVHEAPYMLGRAGCYTFSDEDWLNMNKNKEFFVACCSQTSLYVDVYRLLKKKSFLELRDVLIKSARALLIGNAQQRKKSDYLFKSLSDVNPEGLANFLGYSYNYIRLWNYDLSEESSDFDFDNFGALIKKTNDEIEDFFKTEEKIFKSCGIPIRFRVVVSSAFRRFDKEFLSPRIYKKVTIRNISDYDSKSVINYIRKREFLYELFKGGDRVRFFRSSSFSNEDVIKEFNFILDNFNIHFFTYDFRAMKGEITLDNFI